MCTICEAGFRTSTTFFHITFQNEEEQSKLPFQVSKVVARVLVKITVGTYQLEFLPM
jgi:hypothetical protein